MFTTENTEIAEKENRGNIMEVAQNTTQLRLLFNAGPFQRDLPKSHAWTLYGAADNGAIPDQHGIFPL